jgi:predicted nucleic acid-binding protein
VRPLVVDASAALAIILVEPEAERVHRAIIDRPVRLVPWLFWIEIVNTLARRRHWSASQVLGAVARMERLGLTTQQPDRPALLGVIDAVQGHGLSAYDASYLMLAVASDADLLTEDAALAAAAGDRAIHVGSRHRLAEATARYEARPQAGPDSSEWPGAVAYLSELRREIEVRGSANRKASDRTRASTR